MRTSDWVGMRHFYGALVMLLIGTSLTACGENSKETAEPVVIKGDSQNTDAATCAGYVPGTKPSSDYVCAHNDVRANVSPAPTTPLRGLQWNADLAQVAKAWAETCTWEHNPNRSAEYRALRGVDVYVGENLYMSSGTAASPYDAIAAWAEEAAFYHYETNTCDSGQVCGHYTQVVWAETLEVGCASAFCATIANSTLTNATLVVCDYAPGGNIAGQKPY